MAALVVLITQPKPPALRWANKVHLEEFGRRTAGHNLASHQAPYTQTLQTSRAVREC